jgi:hypothetical protein
MTAVMTPSNTITKGQIAKLQDCFAARLRKSGLQSELVQQVIESHGDTVADEMVASLRKRVEGMIILIPREPISITTSAKHDPDRYYRDRDGLSIWSGMRELVVAKATKTEAGATFGLAVADLGKNATDAQIESALSKDHVFDESALCATIADMIERQPDGSAGALLNNGYVNLFYTSSCVVGVLWSADDREWLVGAWDRAAYEWSAGCRVFSLAN